MREIGPVICSGWLARAAMTAGCATLLTCVVAFTSAAEEGEKIAIEDLLKSGWQVAGYTSTVDNRSTFILFKHPNETHLVQCRTGYDVTREPRVHANCYKLR